MGKTDRLEIGIGEWVFDHAEYDSASDVLYLSIGGPRGGTGEESPEGHILRYDESGEFYGVTLIGVRELLGRSGAIDVTLPKPPHVEHVSSQVLEPALS